MVLHVLHVLQKNIIDYVLLQPDQDQTWRLSYERMYQTISILSRCEKALFPSNLIWVAWSKYSNPTAKTIF
jgi:hypothetical protein